jgi:hypothetical protein
MRRTSTLLALLCLVAPARPAEAGLDLTWSACNTQPTGTGDIALDCGNPDAVAKLFGNFQSPVAIPGFLAMDAVIDIRTSGSTLAPFWHFESGGCNEGAFLLFDAKPSTECPSASNANPWGPNGNESFSAITLIQAGRGGDNRTRVLMTIARPSTTPVPVAAGQNTFAFELDLVNTNEASCTGCSTPAVIGWSYAALYGATGSPTVELINAGTRGSSVAVNGGIAGPTIFAIRPEQAFSGPVPIDVIGRNLVSGTTPRLTRAGEADIVGSPIITSPSGDVLHTTFDATARADGFWNVEASNAAGSDALANALNLFSGFHVDSIVPKFGRNSDPVTVVIYGSQIVAGALPQLRRISHVDIPGMFTTVAPNGGSLTTTFPIQGQDPGFWDVEVTNGDGARGLVPGGFEIRHAIAIENFSPTSGFETTSVLVTITGGPFMPGASASLIGGSFPIINGTGTLVAADQLSITTTFDLRGQPPGERLIRVAQPDSTEFISTSPFRIYTIPDLVAIAPTQGNDQQVLTAIFTGTNKKFTTNTSPRLERPGYSPIFGVGIVVSPDSLRITCALDLRGKVPGLWDAVVENPGGGRASLAHAFELKGAPRVAGITPSSGADSGHVDVVITGGVFLPGVIASLTRAGELDIPGVSITVSPLGDSIYTRFDLTGRTPGSWNVYAQNPDGNSSTLPNGFVIGPTPYIDAISPDHGSNSQIVTATITGHGFSGSLPSLRAPGLATITGFNTVVAPGGMSITTQFDLRGATPGLRNLDVSNNPGGVVGNLANAFLVRAGPQVTAIAPSQGEAGTTVTATIQGSNILAGAKARLTRSYNRTSSTRRRPSRRVEPSSLLISISSTRFRGRGTSSSTIPTRCPESSSARLPLSQARRRSRSRPRRARTVA